MGNSPNVLGVNPGSANKMQYFGHLMTFLIHSVISAGLCWVILVLVYSLQNPRPNSEIKRLDFTYSPSDVQFYKMGILFLVAAIGSMLLFSLMFNSYQINFYGHTAIFSFIMLLLAGFIYKLVSGAPNLNLGKFVFWLLNQRHLQRCSTGY